MARYGMYWGCFVAGRFPWMEKSTRMVMDALGLDCVDIPGVTCCPEKTLMKNMDERVWLATGARNVACGEEVCDTIVTPCPGCNGTLTAANETMSTDRRLRDEVNAVLDGLGRPWQGTARTKHLIHMLSEDVGPDTIARKVSRRLNGLRVAVHYGCHMVRPSGELRFDHPMHPRKFDQLVEATGAKSVDHETKMLCCGGGLTTAGNQADSVKLTRTKLLELKQLGVDAIITNCPACTIQFDTMQFVMARAGEPFDIPVIFYPELLGFALGLDHTQFGLEMHRIDPRPVFERMLGKSRGLARAAELMDLKLLETCCWCRACSNDCPISLIDPPHTPHDTLDKIMEGRIDELIESPEIWHCMECYTCTELCPQSYGMVIAFTALKHAAIEAGKAPEQVGASLSAFASEGILTKPSAAQRKRLGLPEAQKPPAEDIQSIISALSKKAGS